MIFLLILIIAVFIFLAFFVGMNITNVCTLWLFKTFTDMSITVIVFISFAAGIIFSLLCILIGKVMKASHESDLAEAKETAQKNKKKQEKIQKKLDKQVKKSTEKEKSSVESSEKNTDKVVSIEDKIHD